MLSLATLPYVGFCFGSTKSVYLPHSDWEACLFDLSPLLFAGAFNTVIQQPADDTSVAFDFMLAFFYRQESSAVNIEIVNRATVLLQ